MLYLCRRQEDAAALRDVVTPHVLLSPPLSSLCAADKPLLGQDRNTHRYVMSLSLKYIDFYYFNLCHYQTPTLRSCPSHPLIFTRARMRAARRAAADARPVSCEHAKLTCCGAVICQCGRLRRGRRGAAFRNKEARLAHSVTLLTLYHVQCP